MGDCRPPVLVQPGRGLTEDATAAQDITAMALQGALLVHSALPEEINSMAAGGDVKETVMTIPFLRTCIINMIVDLEKNFTLDGNNRSAWCNPKPHGNGSLAISLACRRCRTNMTDQCTSLWRHSWMAN